MNKILSAFLALILFSTAAYTQWSVQTFNPSYADCHFLPNSNTGWVVGEQGSIRKTTDLNNWISQNSGITNSYLMAVYFVDALTGWTGGEDGVVLRTTNGGTNWVQQVSGTTNRILDISFLNANTGIMGMQSGQLLRTTNGGTNWTLITIAGSSGNITSTIMKYDVLSYIALTDNKFFKSTDAGATWIQLTNTPSPISEAHFVTDSYGFAGTFSGTVLKTNNGGINWTEQIIPGAVSLNAIWFLDLNTGVTIASDGKVYNTMNGGSNRQYVETIPEGITKVTNVLNNALLACGSRGVIASGNTLGGSWSLKNHGGADDITDIYFLNNQTGWAATEREELLYTTNAGSNWSINTSVGLERMEGVCFTNNNIGYVLGLTNDDAGGSIPTINKTTDGGSSWNTIYASGSNPMGLQFVNNNDGFMLGKSGANSVVHRTTNAGLNWQTYSTSTEIYDCYFTTQSNGWMCGKSGAMMRSTDGGVTWGTQSTGVTDTLLSVYFRNASFGWACGTNGRIIATTNGGVNWTTQTSGTTKKLTSIEFGSTTIGAVCGVDGTRLATVNGGANWSSSADNSLANLYTVCFTPGNTAFIAGEMGYISINSGLTAIEPNNNTIPSDFSLEQNYPNPFNPLTKINFSIASSSFVKLTVFDVTGKMVEQLVNETMNAGVYNIDFSAAGLSSGVYFYKLETGSYSAVKKMMLIK